MGGSLLILMVLPKFKAPFGSKDADSISPFEHLSRIIIHGTSNLKLAPQMPLLRLLKNGLLRGPWKRHLMEYEMFKTVGSEFTFYLPGSHMSYFRPATLVMFVTHPEDVEQVLSDKDCFPTRGYTGFNELVGEGLLGMVSGPKHHAHRSIVTKFLSDNHLKQFSYVVEEEIAVMLEKWGVGKGNTKAHRSNVQYDLSMLTLDVIMRTGFGAGKQHLSQNIKQEDNHLAHGLDTALKSIVLRTVFPGWEHMPISTEREVNEFMKLARVEAKAIFNEAKQRIEENPNSPPTMLSEMIRMRKSNDEDAKGLTDDEILDELMTLRGAGHETTSNTLSWAMYLLSQHPEVLEELRKESDEIVKGDICTFEESKELKKHHHVVYETLRLYPTVPSFPRECHIATKMNRTGYDVPKGSLVFVSQRPLNRNPEVWDRPEEFVPSRFEGIGEFKMGKPVGVPGGHKFGFAPWGGAQRSCVGARLALLEAVQILATITKRVTWTQSFPMEKVVEVAEVTLGPKEGLYIEIKERN